MTPSKYQTNIILAAKDPGIPGVLVQAAAGSGKTTTLRLVCEAIKSVQPHASILALAFNKVTAEAFAAKLPPGITSATVHSQALRILRSADSRIRVDSSGDKAKAIAKRVLGPLVRSDPYSGFQRKTIKRIVSFCRATMTDPRNMDALQNMIDSCGIQMEAINPHDTDDLMSVSIRDAAHLAGTWLDIARGDRCLVDFDDMVDHVLVHQVKANTGYDFILGDEVQDWNRQQMEFVKHISRPGSIRTYVRNDLDDLLAGTMSLETEHAVPGTKVILVGDRNQSIYGWRGAAPDAMDHLKKAFAATELPLSVCYRCPRKIVELARKIVGPKHIEAAQDAAEGRLEYRVYEDLRRTMQSLAPGTMVICRLNRYLTQCALKVASTGQPVLIRGQNLRERLEEFVAKSARHCSMDSTTSYTEDLEVWVRKEIARLLDSDDEAAANAIDDLRATVRILLDYCNGPRDISSPINKFFVTDSDGTENVDKSAVIFSSIHRAKGLEAKSIVLLGPELCPSPMAFRAKNKEQALIQERNVLYVAVTRAMESLIMQPVSKPEDHRESSLYDHYRAIEDERAALQSELGLI